MNFTSHERIMRIFQSKEVDRPALKLWGVSMENELLHPAYQPVCEFAVQKNDLFEVVGAPFQESHVAGDFAGVLQTRHHTDQSGFYNTAIYKCFS